MLSCFLPCFLLLGMEDPVQKYARSIGLLLRAIITCLRFQDYICHIYTFPKLKPYLRVFHAVL